MVRCGQCGLYRALRMGSNMTSKRQLSFYAMATFAIILACGDDGGDSPTTPAPMVDMSVASDAEVSALDMTEGTPDAAMEMRCLRDDQCESDEYCAQLEGTDNSCRPGCREGGCEEGRLCDLDTRVCVRDESCEADEDCYFGEYCESGTCADGCRVDDPEACPRDEDGLPRACDAESRECVRQVVCCDADNGCALAFADACGDIIEDRRDCSGDANPCEGRCAMDSDCANLDYCNPETLRCEPGCRVDGRGCTEGRICNEETRLCVRPTCSVDGDCAADFFCAIDVCLEGCRFTYGVDPETGDTVVTDPRGNCANPTHICDTRHVCGEPDTSCFNDEACVLALNVQGAYCDSGDCKAPCLAHTDCDCVSTLESPCTDQDIADGAAQACLLGRCVDACRDDLSEPNDTLETATPIAFESAFDSGANGPFMACDGSFGGNVDYHSFVVPEDGMTISVHALFDHLDGDVDIVLYKPNGDAVQAPLAAGINYDPNNPKCDKQGTSCTDNESIVYPSTASRINAAGTWAIKARALGIAKNSYSVRVELAAGTGPDGAEVDNLPSQATVLDLPGMTSSTVIEFRTIHPMDEDWFAIELGQRDGFEIQLETLGNDAGSMENLELQLYRTATVDEISGDECANDGVAPIEGLCSSILQAAPDNVDPNQGPLSVRFAIPQNNAFIRDDTYYLRVIGLTDMDMSRYRLRASVTRYYPLCFVDDAEPNDAEVAAYNLMTEASFVRIGFNGQSELRPGDQRLSDLSLCGGDVDWFSFEIQDGDIVDARIERNETSVLGDTTIELLDSTGTLMPNPVGTNQNRENSVRLPEGAAEGTYFVRVVTNEGTIPVRTNYDLVINRIPGDIQCDPDGFEVPTDNNIAARAKTLTAGTYPNLSVCGADQDTDWYVFETVEDTTIDVSIDFDHRQGNLDILIYYEPPLDDDGNVRLEVPPENDFQGRIDNVAAESDGERVVLDNRPPGNYYIRIKGSNRPTVAYELTLSLTERVYQCEPMESSELLVNGQNLGTSTPQSLEEEYLCYRPSPGDWSNYQMLVPGNGSRTISAHINPDRGKLYLNLLNVDTMLAATTQEYVATESGTHCISLSNTGAELGLYYVQVVPWSINTANERLDFDLRIGDTEDCLDVTPLVDQPYGASVDYERP